MVTSEPAWKPQIDRSAPHEGELSQRPFVTATLRVLNLVAGTIAAFLAFVIVGLYGALQTCVGEETRGLCVDHAGLVPVLEWPIVALAAIAPFAGGVAAFVLRQPRWLGVGIAVAVVMFALMSLVSTGQTSYEFN